MPWQYKSPPELTTRDDRLKHYHDTLTLREQTLFRCGWHPLSRDEESLLDPEIRGRFPICPDSRPPEPYVVWDVSAVYTSGQYDPLEADLNENCLAALRQCTTAGESILAIDWQHPWYSLEPHAPLLSSDPFQWVVPFLPDGCIPIFVPPDFRFGIVGIPHSTICVYGKDLLAAFEKSRPALFSTTMEWRRDPGPKGEA